MSRTIIRQIARLDFPDVEPATITTSPPTLRMALPSDLHVDDGYQRGLSERSVRLIRKIVAEWDWRAFKPPVVVEVDGQLEVIDGQHTAIAAVTHGGIEKLPVLVIEGAAREARANAFVRHNRDRIQVTPMQLHNALVTAGDADAVTIEQACARARVRVLRNPPANGRFEIGDTLAISTIRTLVNRRFAQGARRVLEVCVKAGSAPVSAGLIKAVECLLFEPEYRGEIDEQRIVAVLLAVGDLDMQAARWAAERRVPLWRALASVIFLNRRKGRNANAA